MIKFLKNSVRVQQRVTPPVPGPKSAHYHQGIGPVMQNMPPPGQHAGHYDQAYYGQQGQVPNQHLPQGHMSAPMYHAHGQWGPQMHYQQQMAPPMAPPMQSVSPPMSTHSVNGHQSVRERPEDGPINRDDWREDYYENHGRKRSSFDSGNN